MASDPSFQCYACSSLSDPTWLDLALDIARKRAKGRPSVAFECAQAVDALLLQRIHEAAFVSGERF